MLGVNTRYNLSPYTPQASPLQFILIYALFTRYSKYVLVIMLESVCKNLLAQIYVFLSYGIKLRYSIHIFQCLSSDSRDSGATLSPVTYIIHIHYPL